ncbi:hypothetical protein [Microcoleus sp. T3_A4]|uniref:hypothetical protein n=1 Tax=Microcoleus sp. T3_A4 TaxID=2818968 RepID=UPI002FD3E2F3
MTHNLNVEQLILKHCRPDRACRIGGYWKLSIRMSGVGERSPKIIDRQIFE